MTHTRDKSMKKYTGTFLIILLLLAIGIYFQQNVEGSSAPTSVVADLPQVVLEEISPQADKKKIVVPVKVEAKVQSLVSSDVEGHVTKILRPLGSIVRANEVIMTVENKDPGFTYAAVSIRSPIEGVVSQMWANQMYKINRGDKLFVVLNPKSLKLSAEFPSRELSDLQNGSIGNFRADRDSEVLIPIKITGLSPLVDARTGTASAELEFDQTKLKNLKLPSIGTIGQAIFEIKRGEVVIVPESSLVYQDGKSMVRVADNKNGFKKREVILGEQRDSFFVVKSGISKGEKIIVRSSRPLKENETFKVERQ